MTDIKNIMKNLEQTVSKNTKKSMQSEDEREVAKALLSQKTTQKPNIIFTKNNKK